MICKERFSGFGQPWLVVVAVSVVEVEVVDRADSNGGGVDDTGRHGRGLPVLKLNVGLYGKVMGEVVVQANARGIDEGVGAEVDVLLEEISGGVIVDFAAAEEEVGIGVKVADGVLDFGTDEEVLLAANFTFVDGIGAAGFDG